MQSSSDRYPGLLLLGPTGAGKTPLGELLAKRGFAGRRCLHFDFGAQLRAIVERGGADGPITTADVALLAEVLRTGALLEDEQYPLAERILRQFLSRTGADRDTWIVLNGLPRHAGQAEAMDRLVQLRAVVSLQCAPESVLVRIRGNTGGDRLGRADDHPDAVRSKLSIFARWTAPLLAYYRAQAVPIVSIDVGPQDRPEEVLQRLEHQGLARSMGPQR